MMARQVDELVIAKVQALWEETLAKRGTCIRQVTGTGEGRGEGERAGEEHR